MSFLTVNNHTIACNLGDVDVSTEEIGSSTEGLLGANMKDNRGEIRTLKFTTINGTKTYIDALRRLLLGRGFYWNFNSLGGTDPWQWSSTGLGITSASGVSQLAGSAHFGAYGIELTATTGTATWATAIGTVWTVMFWRNTGAGFEHYIETSDGTYYLDGVATTQESWVSVASGSVTIANTTGGAVDFDDLVVLPFIAPANMAADFGGATSEWGNTPDVKVSGDLFESAELSMLLVRDINLDHEMVHEGGTFQTMQKLSARLREQTAASAVGGFADDYSVEFDGTADYLETVSGDFTTLDGIQDVTVSIWYYVDSTSTNEWVMARYGASGSRQLGFYTRGANWRIYAPTLSTGADYIETNDSPLSTTGSWYHLMLVKSAGSLSMYTNNIANAVTVSGTPSTTFPTIGTTPLRFGTNSVGTPASFFGPGHLGDINIWPNLAATTAQRGEIYNSHSAPDPHNLATTPSPDHSWWMGDSDAHNRIADNGNTTNRYPLQMISMSAASIVALAP